MVGKFELITYAVGLNRDGSVRQVEVMDYPHARVRLHFCKVYDWQGEFEMKESQHMAWQTLPVEVVPVLPGTIPVLQWLAAERGHTGVTHHEAGQPV